jgi:hypothetical protein
MHNLLITFCNWLENNSWALAISSSTWAYPFVQATHFTGLSVWLGTSIAVDLHLLGVGKRSQTTSQLSDSLFVWNSIGLGIAVFGGFLLFSASATTYVINRAFQVKLGILIPLGLVLHVVVQRRVRTWGETPETPAVAKLAGLTEILLWVFVATAAVTIPSF